MADQAAKAETGDKIVIAAALVVLALWVLWLLGLGKWLALQLSSADADAMARVGQFGDMFGALNALFTAAAFVAVWWTGRMQRGELVLQRDELRMQREALGLQREELKLQRGELADTRKVVARQTFESMFFQMLRLNRELHASIRNPWSGAIGSEAMTGLAGRCAECASVAVGRLPIGGATAVREELGRHYDRTVYERCEPTLGPYFRQLYHLFKLIDELDDDEATRHKYANIARAQLSAVDLSVLAANGCSSIGAGFARYIERYGLLKHFPNDLNRPIYEQSCYSRKAFESRYAEEARVAG